MSMILLLAVLFLGGVLAWISEGLGNKWPRYIALATFAVATWLVIGMHTTSESIITLSTISSAAPSLTQHWWAQSAFMWIPRFGVELHFALDGLSWLLLMLTVLLGFVCVACSWTEIQEKVGFFHFNLLWCMAGVVGVFVALDLFLFFFFWEVMLIPMYFLIAIWGHENRAYAAIKFFIFTQASSLLMLLSMIVLVYVHAQQMGYYSFNYFDLLRLNLDSSLGYWLMLGFFIAFAVKLPVVLVHTWLPDAHTEAPTAGSVILAAVLLKTGAYGLIRFSFPLFPEASLAFAPIAMILGAAGILYGAKLAFAQTDLKRLVAYSSVSHMGFVLMGIYAWNQLALQGAVMQMLAHGVSTAALFVTVGALQERLHTREMAQMGGIWAQWPRLSAFALFFAVASLGMPGMGNFVAEFLVLLGSFSLYPIVTILAAIGLIFSAVYSLLIIQKSFWGQAKEAYPGKDYFGRESVAMLAMVFGIMFLGLAPNLVFKQVNPSLTELTAWVDASVNNSLAYEEKHRTAVAPVDDSLLTQSGENLQ